MEMYFKKEGLCSVAILPSIQEVVRGYQSNLFQYHEVPHFLQYEIRDINGKEAICYRLEYRTTVKSVMGHLPFTLCRLKNMVGSIIGAMETAEEYLLDTDFILWNAENVFLEADTGRLQFCYYPAEENSSLKDFLLALMQAVDKKQEEAVLFVLQFYNLVTEESCSVERLLEFRHERIEQEEFFKEMACTEEEERQEDEVHYFEKPAKVVKVLLLLNTAADLILILCLIFDILTYDYLKYLFVGLGALIVLTILYMRLTKEESADEIMQNYFEEQRKVAVQREDQPLENFKYDSKKINNVLKDETPIIEEWGETRLLTEHDLKNNIEEIVVEDEEKQLCLKSIQEGKYADVHFEEESVVVGCMSESCNYILKAAGVSRMRTKLMPKADGVYLLDMNSTNGTYLNGDLIESGREYKLEEGDMVTFARCEFYVVVEE